MGAVVAVVAAIGVLGGCGSGAGTLDQAATETAVGDAVAGDLGVDVVATACPRDVAATRGERFSCSVDLGEMGDLPVSVRVTDDDAALRVVPDAAVLADAEIARQLKAALKAEFDRSFQVDCGDGGPQVRLPDDTFVCRARDKTSRRSVEVTVTDAAGTLSFEVRKPAS